MRNKASWKLGFGLLLASLLPGFFIAASIAGITGAAKGAGLAGGAIIVGYGLLGSLIAGALSLTVVRWFPRGMVSALLFLMLGISLSIVLLAWLRIAGSEHPTGLFDTKRNTAPPAVSSEPVSSEAATTKTEPDAADVATTATSSPAFHTDPSCWSQPRNYHQSVANSEWADKVHLISSGRQRPEQPGTFSPNRAYQYWVMSSSAANNTDILIDNENTGLLVLELTQPLQAPAPQWLNEKLLYLRVAWGRVLFSDVLIDVEQVRIIYHELVHDGRIAFQQYQQACSGPDAADCECQNGFQSGFNLSLPSPANRMNDNSIIGLLAMPEVLPGKDTDQAYGSLPGYIKSDGEYLRITDNLDGSIIESLEYGYEQPGAVIYQRDADWFALRTLPAGRELWMQTQSDFQFYPVEELLPNRLNYLNEHWDQLLWSEPGGENARQRTQPNWQQKAQETPVVIEQTQKVNGQLWLKVGFYTGPICSGPEPAVENGGWIPAYAPSGHLTAWFFSRGC